MTSTKRLAEAVVTLSFDFEIGWGDITNPNWRRRQAEGVYRRERQVLPEILELMDDLDIPATWATVGAMFDDPTRRSLDYLTSPSFEIVHSVLKEAEPESFDGRDLFALVAEAKAAHRFASHSYAHVPFNFPGITKEFVRSDLQQFQRTLQATGHVTDRFVFPENAEGFFSILKQEGFNVARVAADNLFKNRWLYLATIGIVPPPPVRSEVDIHGVDHVFASMLFNDAGQKARVPLLMRRFSLGLKSAIRNKTGFHIWSHPFNFAESDALRYAFQDALRMLARVRDRGEIVIRTM